MDEVKEVINNMIALKEDIEKRIYKYMYISDKAELEKCVAEDKKFISNMQSLLGENNIDISTTYDNVSMPSLDSINVGSLSSTDKIDNNLDNTCKALDESSAIEMLDLGTNLNGKEMSPTVDELQELTSSDQSSVWTPPEIIPTVISTTSDDNKENQSAVNFTADMSKISIPNAQIPSGNDYKPTDDLNSVGATSTNKFIIPEFMNSTSQSL